MMRIIAHIPGQVDSTVFRVLVTVSPMMRQFNTVNRFICRSVLLVLFLGVNVSLAQMNPDDTFTEELHLTLLESIEIALEQNRTLLDSRLNREEQKLRLEVDEKQFDPLFSVNSRASAGRDSEEAADIGAGISFKLPTGGSVQLRADKNITANNSGANNASVTFTQPLLKGAGLLAGTDSLRKSRKQEILNILSFRDEVANLIASVIQSYHTLIQSNMQVQINEGALERARKQRDVTEALIQAGRIAPLEITRSESTIAQRELALLRAKNSRNTSSLTLSNLLNLPSHIRLIPKEDSLEELSDDDVSNIVDLDSNTRQALDNRREIRAAMFRIEDAEISLQLTENQLLPDLSLSATISRDNVSGRSDHRASLNLTIPLNEPDRKLRRVSAKNELIKAKRNLANQRESISSEVRRAATDVELGFRVIQLSREARELAERNLTVELAKFGQGLSSTFEVASSQDELLSAQNSEIQDVIAYRNAKLSLHRAVGIILDVWGIEIEKIDP